MFLAFLIFFFLSIHCLQNMLLLKQSPWSFLPDTPCSSGGVTSIITRLPAPRRCHALLVFLKSVCFLAALLPLRSPLKKVHRACVDYWMHPRWMRLRPRRLGLWRGRSGRKTLYKPPPSTWAGHKALGFLFFYRSEATVVFNRILIKLLFSAALMLEAPLTMRALWFFQNAKFGSVVTLMCDRAATQSRELDGVGQPFKQNVPWLPVFISLTKGSMGKYLPENLFHTHRLKLKVVEVTYWPNIQT